MRYMIAMLFTLSGLSASAQANPGTDNIKWDVDSFVDLGDTTSHTNPSSFFSYANNKIVWVQKDDYAIEYTISSTAGDWTDVTADGSLTFNVTFQSRAGKFVFSRADGTYQIKMEFLDDNGKNIVPYIFHISNNSRL